MANLVTPKFRVSFPKVFKAEINKLNGKAEYSVVALFSKGEDMKALNAAVDAAINEKWPDLAKRPKNLRMPLRDQGEKAKEGQLPAGHAEGAMFLNLKSKNKPGVVDENVQPIIDESQFYPGCYAIASVSVYAYDQAGNRGVGIGLTNIQKVADGEPFSGRPTAEATFKPVAQAAGGSAETLFN